MRETLGIKPGLIVLRYKKGTTRQNAIIRPTVADRSRNDVEIISDPLRNDLVLDKPGDCVILRCTRDASVHLDITSKVRGEHARGSVTVEYLTARKKRESSAPEAGYAYSGFDNGSDQGGSSVRYLGHVSYWGDSWADEGEWIGGPDRPMPLEGLQIEAQHNIMMKDIRSGRTASVGDYLGTRGQSLPLNGLEFWIEDRNSKDELVIEAMFRDAGRVEKVGSFVALVGASYNDVILGLRISVKNASENPVFDSPFESGNAPAPRGPAPEPRGYEPPRSQPPAPRERVKIFRR